MRVRLRRNYIIAELTRELYHNPAVLEICEDDDLVVDEDNLVGLLHDIGVIFGRILSGAAKVEETT